MACPTTTTNKSIWPMATSTKFSNKSVNHIVETALFTKTLNIMYISLKIKHSIPKKYIYRKKNNTINIQ
jgi:hypothetical protein